MKFQMKINDLFRIGEKTIFVGDIKTETAAISSMPCSIWFLIGGAYSVNAS